LEFLESVPFLGLLVSMVGWALGLYFAGKEGINQCRTLARFYTIAAWAWDKGSPQLPPNWLENNKEQLNYSAAQFREAWNKQVTETLRDIPAKVQGLDQAKVKKALKTLGGSQKGTLRFLMIRGLVEIKKKSGEGGPKLNALIKTYAADD
jgi:hypothetical protein